MTDPKDTTDVPGADELPAEDLDAVTGGWDKPDFVDPS